MASARFVFLLTLLAIFEAVAVGSRGKSNAVKSPDATRPNIVFILTDDQDVQMGSLDYMPFLRKHMIYQGTSYTRHYCNIALCCPSRVSLLTGRAAHNTNVTDTQPPYGGYPAFVNQLLDGMNHSFNDAYLPVWLQQAGYETYYVGKFLNYHTILNYHTPYAAGWTGSDFLLDPFQYTYYSPIFQGNKNTPILHNGSYVTDLVAEKSLAFIDEAAQAGNPFFLTIAPNAPHAQVDVLDAKHTKFSIPQPAKRHEELFQNIRVPRKANFNPKEPSGASWIRKLDQLTQEQVDANDEWYRARIRCLQAVDEMIDQVFARLEQHGLLENTYIFFSSDNGYHISQHRMFPGKSCPYEEDINVPLIVRGPGVAAGVSIDHPTSHLDLVPTFFSLARIPQRDDFDGAVIPLGAPESSREWQDIRPEHVAVEMWMARSTDEGGLGKPDRHKVDHTYKSLRLVGEGYSLYYSVWCTNEHELYDMAIDPYQMTNLAYPTQAANRTVKIGDQYHQIPELTNRLDSLLLILKSCKGDSCRNPWNELLPNQQASSLKDAMHSRFDGFFAGLPRVQFNQCEAGYILASEGPQYSGETYLNFDDV
ncbi:alkaline-phosphatase-like protein [Whalleya microplaca]|nr:alkaline-phosphatase-like protein [Whalleya microplaca]